MERKPFDEFDFGYVLTVHKAQGSQWDDVVLFDESEVFRENARSWLYTGVTRAAKRLTVAVP
jgi:exodeoxyribonuclease-5